MPKDVCTVTFETFEMASWALAVARDREHTEADEEAYDTMPYNFEAMVRDYNKHSEQDSNTAKVLLHWHPEDRHLYERCWCQSGGQRGSRVALRQNMTFQQRGVPGWRCRARTSLCICRCEACSQMAVDEDSEQMTNGAAYHAAEQAAQTGESVVVTDARALYDASRSASAGLTLAEKQQHQREVEGYVNQREKTRGAGASSASAVGSAMLAVAPGGRASRMTAAMAALSLADAAGLASELAVFGSCPANNFDYMMMFQYVACGIFLGLAIAGYGWWTCRTGEHKKKTQRGHKKHLRSVKTQSQTTYRLRWATPRFDVLPEGEQGVSLDLADLMQGRRDL